MQLVYHTGFRASTSVAIASTLGILYFLWPSIPLASLVLHATVQSCHREELQVAVFRH
ncbi:hypothetical protein CPB83DRAFT_853139 [Crepidotus variabilis]|uniref:Uncharacterized protein n=1 Tax=Crepidotus variabilis TaxID=179855 RepID=A0A9P6EI25_9AGAR|nr:hypothetical protein CPB83DRAFT_853139 [Crepidotus variabilis]